ncbi:MAG: PASTA domain-containing protein [Candidatus Krumholzibacteria bacterium]|nr:PASTA domain-containing protein [Candidatus Krumholzibacteria bacterium]MDH4335918.1 PASTA domain-containing protein [Candidatus Krumholzibacteria bacterium]MDH5268506.1 PASTA domain-containing protein [Candidatus Krumholzibacteria bacterium]MDH5628431.1 PASTA domain-containing protein [Candidatus Krumholzibacteria bacterium]
MRARRILIRILILAALFTAGVFAFNFVIMPMLVHQSGAVIVPDLRNDSEAQATQTLARLGLKLRVLRSEHSSQTPEGFVISQSPRANDNLKPGRTVTVVTSLGPEMHRVPELRNMSLRQARSLLEQAGLTLGRVSRVTHEGNEREHIVATSPPVGDEVLDGEAVEVVLAVVGGGRTYMMPDLSGEDLFFIREKLEKMGFRVASVRYEAREGVFPNTIVDQRPQAGARIREGESVELVASSSR